jgi:hypothetical protein
VSNEGTAVVRFQDVSSANRKPPGVRRSGIAHPKFRLKRWLTDSQSNRPEVPRSENSTALVLSNEFSHPSSRQYLTSIPYSLSKRGFTLRPCGHCCIVQLEKVQPISSAPRPWFQACKAVHCKSLQNYAGRLRLISISRLTYFLNAR